MPSIAITGASRGLGLAFARHYAAQMYTVIGLVRDEKSAAENLAKQPQTFDQNIHFLQADVTNFDSLQQAAKRTSEITSGSLDILINNAVFPHQTFTAPHQHTPQSLENEIRDSIETNVIGVAHTINAFLPLIRAGTLKKVIHISSGVADDSISNDYGMWHSAPYALSKSAANTLIAKYNASLGRTEGILFLSISPGAVKTQQDRTLTDEEKRDMFEMIAIWKKYEPGFRGPLEPSEVAKMIDVVIREAKIEALGGTMVSHFGNRKWI